MLLSILSGLIYTIMTTGSVCFLRLLPLAFIVLFSILEFAIAFIQAYVFVDLICSYLKGVINFDYTDGNRGWSLRKKARKKEECMLLRELRFE
jgi:hypothetical protein